MLSISGKCKQFSVGIIGCGWLGRALAEELTQQGINVFATRSNLENVNSLQSSGINADILCLPTEQVTVNQHPVFQQSSIVIAITPQFRKGRIDYTQKIQQLVRAAQQSKHVKKIILISTTSAYNGLFGEVDETTELNEEAENVALIKQAEQIVLDFNQSVKSNEEVNPIVKLASVLRLSGLVGPSRHPGNFLKHGRMLNSPNASVNLIHQDDAIGLIFALLKNDTFCGIVNGVSNTNATKAEYYSAAAKALSLPKPCFKADVKTYKSTQIQKSKRVSGNKARITLDYQFIHDDLLNWL
jgi:nucleoside-diphosphate-sugar epimerase